MQTIEEIDKQIKSLEMEKRILEKSISHTSRKERTRRLIQTGALCEKYFNFPEDMPLEVREQFFKKNATRFMS